MKKILYFIISLGLVETSLAAGTAGAQFLKLGAGARAAAMGDAYSSIADDATAAYWNPSGLTQLETPQFSFMHNNWLVDTQYQYLGGAIPFGGKNAIAISLYRLDFGSIDRYDVNDTKNGSFDANSLAASLSYSRKIRENLSFGGSLKLIKETLENESASGVAGDLGAMYAYNQYQFSFAVQHLGSKMKFVQEEEDLPHTLRLGASGRFLEKRLLVGLDVSKPKDNDASVHGGVEYKLIDKLSLRGGYKATPGNSLGIDGLTGLTGGIGVNLGHFSLDYAFVPFGDLDTTHKFSLLVKFAQN